MKSLVAAQMIAIILCLLIGVFAGTLSGLFGIGGGLIVVPTLIYLASYYQLAHDLTMHLVAGTSFGIMMFTSLFSFLAHHRQRHIRWDIYTKLCGGVIIGVIGGAILSAYLSPVILRRVLGFTILGIALHMSYPVFWPTNRSKKDPSIRAKLLIPLSHFIGGNAGLLGIGGGALTVPLLTYCNVSLQEAVPVSTVVSLTIAIIGTIMYTTLGWQNPNLPAGATGYIHWPIVFMVALGSMITAPYSAKLFYRCQENKLRYAFIIFLFINAFHFLF